MALAGTTGCLKMPPSEAGVCEGLSVAVAGLENGLLAHPETPDAVGEPGADVVIGYRAACP